MLEAERLHDASSVERSLDEPVRDVSPTDTFVGPTHLRQRTYDSVLWSTGVVAGASVALPWLFRLNDVSLFNVLVSMLIYPLARRLCSIVRPEHRPATHASELALRYVWVMPALAVAWYFTGALANPVFLLAFALPVVTSGWLSHRWFPFVLAGAAILCVWVVAVASSPALRFMLESQEGALGALGSLPPELAPVNAASGLELTFGYQLTVLLGFCTLILASAAFGDLSATAFLRNDLQLTSSLRSSDAGRDLALAMVRDTPGATVLLDRESGSVVEVSTSLLRLIGKQRLDVVGRSLTETLPGIAPELLEEDDLLRDGDSRFVTFRVGRETHPARLRGHSITNESATYVRLSLEEIDAADYLFSALDAQQETYIVLSASTRVEYFNQPAERLFPDLLPGARAATVLDRDAEPEGWWRSDLRAELERSVEIAERPHSARIDLVRAGGSRPAVTLLRVRPI